MTAAFTITIEQARAAWLTRQRLAGRAPGAVAIAEMVGALGWVPMASSATPYLALLARRAISRRVELDDACAPGADVTTVPGPRGLTWLVPTADAPLARAFAMADHTSREARVAAASGLTARDLAAARDALRDALSSPRTPAELRRAVKPETLRSLGASARRAGLASLAGLVLRSMWIQGEVTRTSIDGRLDGTRVRYAIEPHPRVVPDAADAVGDIAPRWLAAHAPVSVKDFAEAFAIAGGRAASALRRREVVEARVEGFDDPLLVPADFKAPERGREPVVNLLPIGDPLPDARAKLAGLCDQAVVASLSVRHIGVAALGFVDGQVVATWRWESGGVSLHPVTALTSDVRERLELEATHVGGFIAKELGDAQHHGSRQPRGALLLPGEVSVEA